MVSTCQHGGGNRPGEGKVSSAGKEGVEPAYSEGFRRVFTDKGLSNGGRTACRVCHPHVSVSESTSRELQTSAAACVLAKARGHEGRAHNGEEGMLALRSTSARERARGGGPAGLCRYWDGGGKPRRAGGWGSCGCCYGCCCGCLRVGGAGAGLLIAA